VNRSTHSPQTGKQCERTSTENACEIGEHVDRFFYQLSFALQRCNTHVFRIRKRTINGDASHGWFAVSFEFQLAERCKGIAGNEEARGNAGEGLEALGKALMKSVCRRNRAHHEAPAIERRFELFEGRNRVAIVSRKRAL